MKICCEKSLGFQLEIDLEQYRGARERERPRLAMFRQPLDLVTVSADVEVSDLSSSLNGLPDVSP